MWHNECEMNTCRYLLASQLFHSSWLLEESHPVQMVTVNVCHPRSFCSYSCRSCESAITVVFYFCHLWRGILWPGSISTEILPPMHSHPQQPELVLHALFKWNGRKQRNCLSYLPNFSQAFILGWHISFDGTFPFSLLMKRAYNVI